MRASDSRGGSESGVWEGDLQFPSLLSNPTAISRTASSHPGAAALTSLGEGAEPLLSARLIKQKPPLLPPELPALPISGSCEDAYTCVH